MQDHLGVADLVAAGDAHRLREFGGDFGGG